MPLSECKAFLASSEEGVIRVLLNAYELGQEQPFYDPIEDDDRFKGVIAAVKKSIEKQVLLEVDGNSELGVINQRRGISYRINFLIKETLKNDHDIIWYSPVELNPNIHGC